MPHTDTSPDAALLRRYLAGDHGAFRALVDRHTDWVFATARRQAPDTATAEDITQAVFLLLARRAARLPGDTRITGFLFKAACFAARTARRAAARRRRHEHKAAAMKPAQSTSADPHKDFDLEFLQPRLDALLLSLPARDRTAILLRFYQQRPLAELAAALHTSEKGAAKQVARALDRLRRNLPRHAALSSSAIALFLSTRLAHAAPPALAHAAATTALSAAASGAVSPAIALLAKGAMHMFTTTLRLSCLSAALIFAAAIPTILAASAPSAPPSAPAAASATKPSSGESADALTIERVGDKVVYRGTLVDWEGKGIGGARYKVFHFDGSVQRVEAEGVTGSGGEFVVGPVVESPPSTLDRHVVLDVPGKAWAWGSLGSDSPGVLLAGRTVEVREGKLVGGVVRDEAGKAVAGAVVEALVEDPRYGPFEFWEATGMAVRTDDAGRFVFQRVPVGARLALQVVSAGGQYSMWREFGVGVYPVRAGMEDLQMVVRPGGTVKVAVEAEGKGLAGVWVEGTERFHMEVVRRVKTGADGVAAFSQLGVGTWDFVAKRQAGLEGVAARLEGVAVARGKTEEVKMAVVAGVEMRGKLVEIGTGDPVRVPLFVQPGDNGRLQQRVVVDGEGKFSVRVAPGTYTVMCNGVEAGQQKTYEQVVEAKAGMGEVVLSVHPWARVKGVLVDEQGKGVKGMVVLGYAYGTVTDGAGRFELTTQGANGSQVPLLAVDAAGKLGRGVVVDMEQRGEVRVELLPMGSLSGRVVDGAGGGVADGKIDLAVKSLDGSWAIPLQSLWHVAMGADGGFVIAPVPAGLAVDLQVHRDGEFGRGTIGGELRSGEERKVGEVVMRATEGAAQGAARTSTAARVKRDAEVSGVVVDETGKVVVGARVMPTRVRAGVDWDVTDVHGEFTLPGLAPDEEVEVSATVARRSGTAQLTPGKRGEVKVLQAGQEFLEKAAPALLVDRWIVPGPGGRGPSAWADLKGNVVLLQVGANWKNGGWDVEQVKGLLKRHGAQGLVGVTLHIRNNSSDAEMAAYVKREEIDWALGVDADPRTVAGWGRPGSGSSATEELFGGKPGLFLIDGKGVLRAAPEWREMDAEVEKLLGE